MIGAGGVATVCAFKIAMNQGEFDSLMIASHHKEKCDRLVESIHRKGYNMPIETAEVDADDVEQLKKLFTSYRPDLVINLALPYQDLTIMDACLACGCVPGAIFSAIFLPSMVGISASPPSAAVGKSSSRL